MLVLQISALYKTWFTSMDLLLTMRMLKPGQQRITQFTTHLEHYVVYCSAIT